LDRPSTITIRGEQVTVKAFQIVVWVSVTTVFEERFAQTTPRFPAILDTGSMFTFAIREAQLRKWAGIHCHALRVLQQVRHQGRSIPMHAAKVWLHQNQPGERDQLRGQKPFRMQNEPGIAVYPNELPYAPRLPLLGLRALMENELHLLVNSQHKWVSLRSPDWQTRLLPWFGW
jgi:hypothetical protein